MKFSDMHDDERVLRFLKSQIKSFVDNLMMHHIDEETTKKLLSKLADVQLLPFKKGTKKNTYTSGMFDHSTGILYIAPRDASGEIRSESSLNKSICHELGHATRFKYMGETSHSDEWKEAWKHFLKIATGELGWTVEAPCSSKSFYGLNHEDCPGCDWEDDEKCKADPIK